MVATIDVKEDDIVAFIPEDLLLTVKQAKDRCQNVKTLMEKGLVEKLKAGSQNVILALFVMEQRRLKEAHWTKYFKTWREDFDNHLIFWSEEDMAWLNGSEMQNFVRQSKTKLEHDYALISENIPGFSDEFPEREFQENFKAV